jgi:hypothetical protein
MASPLTVSELFTPQPPGFTAQNPGAAPLAGSWLEYLVTQAAALNLSTTAWLPGEPSLTIYQSDAVAHGQQDSQISVQAQGGFLDFAANGVVPFTDVNGNVTQVPVSPDPSVPGQNPSGAPTWLDLLASSVYRCRRFPVAPSSGTEYFVNTQSNSIGTFTAGTFHVSNTVTAATYSNQATFAATASPPVGTSVTAATATSPVAVSLQTPHGLATGVVVYAQGIGVLSADGFYQVTVTGAKNLTLNGSIGSGSWSGGGTLYLATALEIAADVPGSGGDAATGQIGKLITAAPGCFVSNLGSLSGANWESNQALASRCRCGLGALSVNGPNGAYIFWALASYLVASGHALGPALPSAVTAAFAAFLIAAGQGPIVANPLPAPVLLDGGPITKAIVNPVLMTGGVVVTVASGAGAVDASDLAAVNAIIQAYATPKGVTSGVQSATGITVNVAATVYVPAALVGAYQSQASIALGLYFATLPIGGLNIDNNSNVLPIDAIEGTLFAAGQANGAIYTINVYGLTLNGGSTDIVVGVAGVATLGTVNLNVVGV